MNESADEDGRLPCYSIRGVRLYEWLDGRQWSPLWLLALTTSTFFALHLALFLLTGGLAGSDLLVAAVGTSGYVGLFIWTAALGGFYVGGLVIFSRNIQDKLVAELAPIDPTIVERISELQPGRTRRIANLLLFIAAIFCLLEVVLLPHLGISYLEPRSIIAAGPGAVALFFVIYPLTGAAFSQFFPPIRCYDKFLQRTARTIRIDILRVEDYAALIHPAVIVFITCCVILGILIGASAILDVPAIERTVNLTTTLFLVAALIGIGDLCIPILILRNRIVAELAREREAVIRGLDGDRLGLANSRLAADYDRAELLGYLAVLDNLSEWPVRAYLQKIILFGLLPPVAWALAATVENALY